MMLLNISYHHYILRGHAYLTVRDNERFAPVSAVYCAILWIIMYESVATQK